jgi:hypothetical protein
MGKHSKNETRFSQGVHAIGCSVACKLVVPLAPLAGKKTSSLFVKRLFKTNTIKQI